ncbi:unnamed protein product [Blepharisma stoltei]|uniref:Uncharacterized protein n=1 Tax=Blepharisma stoltei TaxID=1481888 RepID=A0AAU9JV68_9CILI|nr:unnamed protein product [Blepharisma stoltei]
MLKISELNVIKEMCLGTNTMMLKSNIEHIYVVGLKIWRYPKKFDVPAELEVQQICCGMDYFQCFLRNQGLCIMVGLLRRIIIALIWNIRKRQKSRIRFFPKPCSIYDKEI